MAIIATLGSLAVNGLAVVLLAWTAWLVYSSREQPSAIPFVGIVISHTVWALLSFTSELPGFPSGGVLSATLSFGQLSAAVIIPGLWLVYALGYTGRGTGLTWKRVAVLLGIVIPILLSAVAIGVGQSEEGIERMIAPLIGWEVLYLFALFVYGTYLLFNLGGSHPRVSYSQVGILTGGVAAPYLFSLIGNNTDLVRGTSIGLVLSGILLIAAIQRYPVLTGFPKADYVARTRVVETLEEATVVLDWGGHILDVNEAAAELFDSSEASMIGEPIRSVIDGLEQTNLPVGATGTVPLQTSKGRRQFRFRVSAVTESETADESNPVARTVLFEDVTDQQTREQRLAVLNRILRHNVRNELDVILAYADQIEDHEIQTAIREHTTKLLDLSKKVRDAESVMTERTDSPEEVDVPEIITSVVATFQKDEYKGKITLDCPEELRTRSHRAVLEKVITELVENAIEHSDKESPQVTISVRQLPDVPVEISIADDGPGLPEREQEILAAGTETQLKHGRGIGLWFVNWAVTQLGGELQFQPNTPEGSIVTIRLFDSVT